MNSVENSWNHEVSRGGLGNLGVHEEYIRRQRESGKETGPVGTALYEKSMTFHRQELKIIASRDIQGFREKRRFPRASPWTLHRTSTTLAKQDTAKNYYKNQLIKTKGIQIGWALKNLALHQPDRFLTYRSVLIGLASQSHYRPVGFKTLPLPVFRILDQPFRGNAHQKHCPCPWIRTRFLRQFQRCYNAKKHVQGF